MEKFIPYEKLSKSKRRELDNMKRSKWTMSPVTRKPDNPKAYKRKKTLYDEGYMPDCKVSYFLKKINRQLYIPFTQTRPLCPASIISV